MPKVKTNRSAAKRFRKTASGQIKGGKAGRRHILTKKSRGRKRSLREPRMLSKPDRKLMERLLPYL